MILTQMDQEVQSELSKQLYITKSHQAKAMDFKVACIHINDHKVKRKYKYNAQERLQSLC